MDTAPSWWGRVGGGWWGREKVVGVEHDDAKAEGHALRACLWPSTTWTHVGGNAANESAGVDKDAAGNVGLL